MRTWTIGPVVALSLAWVGCGGGATVLVSTPTPPDVPPVLEITGPEQGLEIESLDVEWTPVMIGGDRGKMLGEAIADREALMMILGRGLQGAAWEDRVFQMVKAASPDTKVVARARATLDTLMQERGEIPYRVTMQPAGTDVLGRPYFLPKEHPLNTDWLSRKKAMKGADAVLAIRRVQVDDRKLRLLREEHRGSCAQLETAIEGSINSGARQLETFSDAADERLEKSFSRHLAEALPFWKKEIESARERTDPSSPAGSCLDAYREFIERYEGCVEKTCEVGPRFSAAAGGIIGMDMAPFSNLPDRCAGSFDRDYGEEMAKLAERTVKEVLPAIGDGWSSWMIKRGALAELSSGMGEVCAARHRRLSTDDLERARSQVGAFGRLLAQTDFFGEWSPAGGMERIAGIGPVRVLARLRPTGENPVSGASELVSSIKAMDRCREGREELIQASLIDVGTSEVVFMGIFFQEQLLCDDMPPGSP